MLTKKILWLSFLTEEGESGGGSEQQESTGGESQQEFQGSIEQQQESGGNPNWKELLDDLPDDFLRSRVRPHLEKYDKNNNQRFEKIQQQFSPYKVLADNQVPFEDIQNAFRLRQEIVNNPQVIFERLAAHLGHDITALQNSQGGKEPGNSQSQVEGVEEPLDPRLQQMQRNLDAMMNVMALQAEREMQGSQQQQEQQWYNETKAELDRLQVADKAERNMAVQFALIAAQRDNRPISIEQGVREMRAFQGQSVQNARRAPGVSAGVGGFVSEQPDFSKMSRDQINDYAVERMRAMNGG